MEDESNAENKTVMEPRPYQLELVDYVVERNAIIYLPTGAGKTFVAILALKRYAHTLQGTIKTGGKRAIFICNTVELARQQYNELKKTTNLKIGLYIGDRGVDNWEHKKWELEIVQYQVLVGTPQIFVDIVTQSLLKITDLSIVIIDECHHAKGDHPMHVFMSTFRAADPTKLPRVIGLTGVLIKGNKLGNVLEDLRKLESALRGNIITVRSMEQMQNVMVYSTKPFEELVTFNSNRHVFQIEERIKQLVEECKTVIDNCSIGNIPLKLTKNLQQLREPSKKNSAKNLLNDFVYQMNEFGLYAASLAIMSPIIEFEIKKRQSETLTLRNLYRIIIQHCERIRHIIIKELKNIVDPDEDSLGNVGAVHDKDIHTLDVMLNYATPKLKSLLSYITEKFKGKNPEDISCLIFVDRRYTAKCLYHVLLRYAEVSPDLKNVIRPQFMVGRQSILGSIETILDAKWNKTAIDDFRDKECNIIICSNVLEEGIDVQACNYVFAFDPLKTFNSYIQTKGRARSQNSFYSIFTPTMDQGKTVEQIKKYRAIHEQIKHFLMTRIMERADPNEEEVSEQFIDLIPPYIIPSGARLLATTALALLHRYCQGLPWDSFGSCQPWYCKLPPNNKRDIAVSLKLPLQSTVKETITGDYMKSAREAKISAAFKACIKLYENGELNEFLLPVTKAECIAKVADNLFEHWKKFNDDVRSKTVGKQLRRVYDRKYPTELYNALPQLGQTSYAYAIEFLTDFEVNSYNEHIVQYLRTNSTYAILLSKKLPKLAEMPLFMSQGQIRVNISETPIEYILQNKNELLLLKNFHAMIFSDILNLWKEFLVMDRRNMENSYLIVPLDEKRSIDWGIVQKFQRLQPNRQPTLPERKNARYNPNEYLDKVITKWYNEVESERFVVTKIRKELTPLSPFDSNSYDTYASFFKSRYNVCTVNNSQFLLEVKALTHRRNFFNNANNKSSEKRKERNTIILIPELCHNYQYPANLWLKAILLPSILHRVFYMLHAETLRRRINQYLDLDRYFTNYTPKPLIIDCSLKRVLDDDGNLIKDKEHPKKLLSSLPTKENTEDYQVLSLDGGEGGSWKSYLEPIDLDRKLDKAYPVEVDYYYKFISAIVTQMNDLKLNEEKEWTKSQFDVCVPKVQYTSAALNQLSIKDSPIADKTHIQILKQHLQPDHKLQSAEQFELLAALTTAGVLDVFDMERFELLGDAFLKFSVSLYLANKYTTWNEGFLTIVKGRIVSNRNLLYCLMGTDICQRISSMPFKPSTAWIPPLYSLPANLLQLLKQNLPAASSLEPADFYNMKLNGKEIQTGECSPEKLEHFVQACNKYKELSSGNVVMNVESDMNLYLYKDVLRDKVVADTLEAILGVCVKNYGIHRSFRMLEFFGICKSDRDNPLTNLLDLNLKSKQLRTSISGDEVNGFLVNSNILEKNLGYTFRDRAYLLQALTHPSYPTNRLTGCYQELEFIGDAILDMLVTCYIFERHQNMDPGKMTDLRSALVNNVTLGCICVRYRLHLFLLYENAPLAEAIKTFADFQDTQNHLVTDQVRILMEEDSNVVDPYSCIEPEEDADEMSNDHSISAENTKWPPKGKTTYNMASKVDVPKTLGDIVEALIGAIYLDCRDLDKTWQVIYRLLENELNEFARNVPIDPIRQLGEIKQANPKYSDALIENDVIMVKCVFNCLDRSCTTNGFGSNAVLAKKAAAKQALKILSKYSN